VKVDKHKNRLSIYKDNKSGYAARKVGVILRRWQVNKREWWQIQPWRLKALMLLFGLNCCVWLVDYRQSGCTPRVSLLPHKINTMLCVMQSYARRMRFLN